MKKFILIGIAAFILVIGGCGAAAVVMFSGDDTEDNTENVNVSSNHENEGSNNENDNEDGETETEELDQEIADDDNVKITLVEVERTEGDMLEEAGYEVLFEIENKRDETIEVQAREMSIDGKMVEDFDYSMSTEISGGKEADADLTIGGIMAEDEIPEVEDEIEFQLHVLDWEDIDFEEDYDVVIEFD